MGAFQHKNVRFTCASSMLTVDVRLRAFHDVCPRALDVERVTGNRLKKLSRADMFPVEHLSHAQDEFDREAGAGFGSGWSFLERLSIERGKK